MFDSVNYASDARGMAVRMGIREVRSTREKRTSHSKWCTEDGKKEVVR